MTVIGEGPLEKKKKHWTNQKTTKKQNKKQKKQKNNIQKLFGEGSLEKKQKNIGKTKKTKQLIFRDSLGRAPIPTLLEYCFFFVFSNVFLLFL